jgi:hypothetical protein
MIYTDGKHLVADSIEELHTFAKEAGLRKEWFQNKRIPHYDITTVRKLNKVLSMGAELITTREIIVIKLKWLGRNNRKEIEK